jgi:hypothetical protein
VYRILYQAFFFINPCGITTGDKIGQVVYVIILPVSRKEKIDTLSRVWFVTNIQNGLCALKAGRHSIECWVTSLRDVLSNWHRRGLE